jgi:hypothetical protein
MNTQVVYPAEWSGKLGIEIGRTAETIQNLVSARDRQPLALDCRSAFAAHRAATLMDGTMLLKPHQHIMFLIGKIE